MTQKVLFRLISCVFLVNALEQTPIVSVSDFGSHCLASMPLDDKHKVCGYLGNLTEDD